MDAGRKNIGPIQLVLLICLINTAVCQYFPQDVNNNTEVLHQHHHRSRRDLERDEKICGDLDKAGSVGSVLSKIPIIGDLYDTALTVATFGLKTNYIDTDCGDIPFEKIKKQMTERFDKLDAKVERNFVKIHQLYAEIHRLFNQVTLSIKDSRIQPILSGMKMFIEGFSWYQSRIDEYFNDDNFEEVENVLEDLRDAVKRIGGQLSIQVNDILNQNFAFPQDGDDTLSILALNALYYGVQAHVSVLLFLLEKRTLLADYYYKNLDIENYHKQLRMMKVVYSDLKALRSKNDKTNLGNDVFGYGFRKNLGQDNSLVDRFYSTAELAARKIAVQRRDSDKALKDSIHEHIEALKKTNNEISNLYLSIIKETPELSEIKIKNQKGKLRVIGDKNHVTVAYAIQYKRNTSSYHMVSDWTIAYELGAQQYADIEMPTVTDGTTRLIFRQISSEKRPQLVGIIDNPDETFFKDIHRDLYNVGRNSNSNSSANIAARVIKNGANINAIFENGRRPFHAAAEAKNEKVVNVLLENGGNINIQDDDGYTPLHLAAKRGHSAFCNFLISKRANGNIKSKSEGLTPLHVAVIHKQIPTVEVLIRSPGVDVNLGDKNGDTPLHYAVNISQSAVKALIANGNVDVNARNKEGFSPLHYAVTNKAEDIILDLLSTRRLDVNAVSTTKVSPLHMAVLDNSIPMTKFLLDRAGVNVNLEGPEGLQPIHFAVMAGNKNITQLLIQKNANLAALSKAKWTPLHFAITLRNKDIVRVLLDNDQAKQYALLKTDEGYTPLHMAASAFGDDKIAVELIAIYREKANVKTNDGLTPLHIAAAYNRKHVAHTLMQYTEKSGDGKLFWELAAAKDSVDVIEGLVINLTPEEQRHLLYITARNDSSKVLKHVIEVKKFTYNDTDRQGLLYTSIEHKSIKTMKYLIDRMTSNADAWMIALDKKKHLHAAVKTENLSIVQYLIHHTPVGVYFNNFLQQRFEYVDKNGRPKQRTALHEAVYSGNIPIIKFLAIHFKDFDTKDDLGKTAADVAKEKGLQDIYRLLKYHNICEKLRLTKKRVKIEDDFAKTDCYDTNTTHYTSSLHLAINHDNDSAKDVLAKGADVNRLDASRNTPLHLALEKEKFDLADLIMKEKPDVRIKNNDQKKPIDLAREHGASKELIAKIEKLEHDLNVKDGFTK